jgi:hypothetical protein
MRVDPQTISGNITMLLDRARYSCLAAIAAAFLFPVNSSAEDAGPSPQIAEAYGIVIERLGRDLSHHAIANLSVLAHATAASLVCNNLMLDEEAVKAALDAPSDEYSKMTDDEKRHQFNFALVAFGALSALMVDEATGDKVKFCKVATEDAGKAEAGNLLKIRQAQDEK